MLAPVGIAYAVASGVGAIYGLYATIACLLAYALFGPSASWSWVPTLHWRRSYSRSSPRWQGAIRLARSRSPALWRLSRVWSLSSPGLPGSVSSPSFCRSQSDTATERNRADRAGQSDTQTARVQDQQRGACEGPWVNWRRDRNWEGQLGGVRARSRRPCRDLAHKESNALSRHPPRDDGARRSWLPFNWRSAPTSQCSVRCPAACRHLQSHGYRSTTSSLCSSAASPSRLCRSPTPASFPAPTLRERLTRRSQSGNGGARRRQSRRRFSRDFPSAAVRRAPRSPRPPAPEPS